MGLCSETDMREKSKQEDRAEPGRTFTIQHSDPVVRPKRCKWGCFLSLTFITTVIAPGVFHSPFLIAFLSVLEGCKNTTVRSRDRKWAGWGLVCWSGFHPGVFAALHACEHTFYTHESHKTAFTMNEGKVAKSKNMLQWQLSWHSAWWEVLTVQAVQRPAC